MYKYIALIILFFINSASYGIEPIRIVGSATLYPFITIAAERFGNEGNNYTPIVESNGTGGGINLLCKGGNALNAPDIASASRKINASELKLCLKNGIKNLKEIKIGFDGIVLAQNHNEEDLSLKTEEIALAISEMVPLNGKMVKNFYTHWNQINPLLPKTKIIIYGPSSTSGTRDLINEIFIKNFAGHSIRQDGYYIEMPENNNLIIHKLSINPKAIGIISFSFLDNNSKVKAISIDGVFPSAKTIRNKTYPLARELYLYINANKYKQKPTLKKFVKFIESPQLIGKNGYLFKRGLITIY